MSLLDALNPEATDKKSSELREGLEASNSSYLDKKAPRDLILEVKKCRLGVSQKDGEEFFIFVGVAQEGSTGMVKDKGATAARPVETGDEVSVYISLSEAQDKFKRKFALQEFIDAVAGITGTHRREVMQNFEDEYREALEDGMPDYIGKHVRISSGEEKKGWYNFVWEPVEAA